MRYYNIIKLKLQPSSNWSLEIINKKNKQNNDYNQRV